MDEEIKRKIEHFLRTEGQNIMDNGTDIYKQSRQMDIIFNFKKILDNYDELKPILVKYFGEKTEKERFGER